ncbi:hypothetical protein HDV00_008641 [Rhizophlyctis rosea]|nr:hypothetical protein HDV00_008641 [Rhizophlyctis rosea]
MAELEGKFAALQQEIRAKSKDERHFQAILQRELNSGRMRVQRLGITDITTDDAHIEIKRWNRFHEVPGQLAKYNQGAPRQVQQVYFFGQTPGQQRLQDIYKLMRTFGIEVYSFDENDIPWRHDTQEAESAESAAVSKFVREKLVRDITPGVCLQWTDLRDEFANATGNKPPHSTANKEPPWHAFLAHGLEYVKTTVDGKNFRGFRGWKIRNGEEEAMKWTVRSEA